MALQAEAGRAWGWELTGKWEGRGGHKNYDMGKVTITL